MDRLKSIDPESCAALGEADGAELKADLNRQFPELSRREFALRQALIVSTDLDRPVPAESQIERHLTGVFTKMQEQFQDDANLLGKDTLEPSEYKRFCEVKVSLCQEIMRLPNVQAADVLRYLYSEK